MNKLSELFVTLVIALFYVHTSFLLFNKIFDTSEMIVDEFYHIPQGKEYCRADFKKWDKKTTTHPGLHLTSTVFCGLILKNCSAFCLRFTNLLASTVNLMLFYLFRRVIMKEPFGKSLLTAINLSIFPPLHFYSHVYYPDVLSVTSVMLLLFAGIYRRYFLFAILGGISIMYRQTNVIWVLFVSMYTLSGRFYHTFHYSGMHWRPRIEMSLEELNRLRSFPCHWKNLLQTNKKLCWEIIVHLFPVIGLVVFLYITGRVTIDDKPAQAFASNIPQLFYFSVFTVFFAWPFLLRKLGTNCTEIFGRQYNIFLTWSCVTLLTIYFDTKIHPNLLADNRHIVYYVWNQFLNTEALRSSWVPLYVFCLFLITKRSFHASDVRFFVAFYICLIPGLCFASLLEIRYFLIPFVLFRIFILNTSKYELYLEFVFNILFNILFFGNFFNTEIRWRELRDVQRIIW